MHTVGLRCSARRRRRWMLRPEAWDRWKDLSSRERGVEWTSA